MRMPAGSGQREVLRFDIGPTCKTGLAAMEHKLRASATIALLRAATDYNNVAM
jgi:hypothetical protein